MILSDVGEHRFPHKIGLVPVCSRHAIARSAMEAAATTTHDGHGAGPRRSPVRRHMGCPDIREEVSTISESRVRVVPARCHGKALIRSGAPQD